MNEEERALKMEITRILIEVGIPINLQGFNYFKESIYIAYNQPEVLKRITKGLYPQVGEIFDVKPTAIERCMRHAAELGYFKTGFKIINNYFGIAENVCNYKPTNSELIALIVEYLRMENSVA